MVECGHCGGHGKVEFTGDTRDTLELLDRVKGVTGAVLAEKVGIKATAMNNRLAYLLRMGLARCVRHGQKKIYFRV
jgi:predicted ArsR family transcriptional regulator